MEITYRMPPDETIMIYANIVLSPVLTYQYKINMKVIVRAIPRHSKNTAQATNSPTPYTSKLAPPTFIILLPLFPSTSLSS